MALPLDLVLRKFICTDAGPLSVCEKIAQNLWHFTLFKKQGKDRELDEEIESHLQMTKLQDRAPA